MIYKNNNIVTESEFTLDFDGGMALIEESNASFNKLLKSVVVNEDTTIEVINEGAKEFLTNLKEWFKNLLDKVRTFFAQLIGKLKGKNNKLKEKAKEIDIKDSKKEVTDFEGYIFTNLDQTIPDIKAYNFNYASSTNSWSTWADEDVDEEINDYISSLTNNRYMDEKDLNTRFKLYFHSGKLEKQNIASIYKNLDINKEINNVDKLLNGSTSFLKVLQANLETSIRTIDRVSTDTIKNFSAHYDANSYNGKQDIANINKSLSNWGRMIKTIYNSAIQFVNVRMSAINEYMDQLNRFIGGSSSSSTNESYLNNYLNNVVLV